MRRTSRALRRNENDEQRKMEAVSSLSAFALLNSCLPHSKSAAVLIFLFIFVAFDA